MKRLLLTLVIGLCFGQVGFTREIYVDNVSGNDRSHGITATIASGGGGPVRTITRALRVAKSGDVIVLAQTGEPYRESVTLQATRHSGGFTKPFRIVGNGAVLDGSKPVPYDAWEHYIGSVFRFRPNNTAHQQLFRNDVPLERRYATSFNKSVPKLKPLEWCLLDGWVYFHCEKDTLPSEHQLTHSSLTVGITLYQVRHVEISDLVVQGFQLDGINAHDGVTNCQLINITSRGNGRSGISIGGASRVKIGGAVLGNNGVAQLRTEGACKVEIEQSDLISNPAPAIIRDGGRITLNKEPFLGDKLITKE
jgi:hypothetical protein